MHLGLDYSCIVISLEILDLTLVYLPIYVASNVIWQRIDPRAVGEYS
jgi:hypothetical protein